MSSPAWSRLEDLFHRAAELPAPERAVFLDSACAGDAALRAEIESLLHNDAPPGTGLHEAIQQEAQGLAQDEWLIGRRIGPYRITGVIGEGGMGAVYEAVRDDDQYRKQVAIKLVRHGLETEALLRGFRAERQILASLDHPYIARLLDGGATADGFPYLVMELVAGVPITRYVSGHGLSLEARVHLFQKVCDAVEYAHQSLVVHRDLKPANILVTQDGVPKLLDFGIAKLLNPLDEDGTATRIAPWTPDYVSPEQVRGAHITTRSDVYSLGLILFELLTGERAQISDSSSPATLERSICEVEIPRASSKAPRALAHRLAGDLDTIIAKAAQKEPERRYASAADLSEDLRRYLDGHPVRARKVSAAYRTSKFLRRNWLPVGAATVAVLGLAAGAIGFAWQARVADRSRRAAEQDRAVAEQQRDRAAREHTIANEQRDSAHREQVHAEEMARQADAQRKRADERTAQMSGLAQHAVFDLYAAVAKLSGSLEARRTMLKTTIDYLENLRADKGTDPEFIRMLGDAYVAMGDIEGSPTVPSFGNIAASLEHYSKALTILTQLAEQHPSNVRYQIAFGGALERLGLAFQYSGKQKEAFEYFDKYLALSRRAASMAPQDPLAVTQVALASRDLAALLAASEPDRAEPYTREAVDVLNKLLKKEPDNPDYLENLASMDNRMATIASRRHDVKAAADYVREGTAIRERLLKLAPDDGQRLRGLWVSYGRLGDTLGGPTESLGDTQGAIESYRKCVALAREMLARDPKNNTAKGDLANSLFHLAIVLSSDAERAESVNLVAQAVSGWETILAASPTNVPVRKNLGSALTYWSVRLHAAGDRAAALERARRAIEYVAAPGTAGDASLQAQLALTLQFIAVLLAEEGNRDGAMAQFKMAAEIVQRHAGGAVVVSAMPTYFTRVGEMYDALARGASAPPDQRMADWRAAADAYQRAAAEWRKTGASRREAEAAALEARVAEGNARMNGR
jgi:tetratricopeptide (TPR) repeat protein